MGSGQGSDDIATWIRETTLMLRAAGVETPERDARLLAVAGCGLAASRLLAEPEFRPSGDMRASLDDLRRRRLSREPVSRILGRRGFMDLDLEITPATLDPRADTETLVNALLARLAAEDRLRTPLSVLDLGTGSGALLIALLSALPNARGLGTDVSVAALEVARRNSERSGVGDRATWRRGSWFDAAAGTYDVIVSNPPYIRSGDIAGLAPEVAIYDPRLALDGGADGLECYREIVGAAGAFLAPGAWLVLEVGSDQAGDVSGMVVRTQLSASGHVDFIRDLGGNVRCVAVKTRNP